MDKIISITSGINWSKARKHVEHSCLVAGSASLPEKPTYISSALSQRCERAATPPRGRRLAQVRVHWHKSSHQQDYFKVITYEKDWLRHIFAHGSYFKPQKNLLSQVSHCRQDVHSKNTGTVCAGKRRKSRNCPLSCGTDPCFWGVWK